MADNFGFNVLTTSDNVDITKIDENFKKIDEKLAINNKIEPTSSLPASQAAVAEYVEKSADKILYTGSTDEIGSSVQSALDYLVAKTSTAAPTTAEDISYQSTYKEEVTNVKEALDNLENEFIGQSFTIADVQNQASRNTLDIEGINEKLSTIQAEGKYELIETIEVTEDMVISRTEEPDGTPYSFSAMFIQLETTAAVFSAIRLYFSYVYSNKPIQHVVTHDIAAISNNTATRRKFIEAYLHNGWWDSRFVDWYQYAGATNLKANVSSGRFEYSTDNAPIINRLASSGAVSAGTTIKIWGVRK